MVCPLGLDFSKAFDTVRHYTLLEKMAMLDIPDTVYNWVIPRQFNKFFGTFQLDHLRI